MVAPIKITDELTKFEKNVLSVIRENLPGSEARPGYKTKYEKNGPTPYKPHITLGYIKRDLSEEVKEELSSKVPNILTQEDFENTTWEGDQFELGRSANNSGSYYLEPYVIYSFH